MQLRKIKSAATALTAAFVMLLAPSVAELRGESRAIETAEPAETTTTAALTAVAAAPAMKVMPVTYATTTSATEATTTTAKTTAKKKTTKKTTTTAEEEIPPETTTEVVTETEAATTTTVPETTAPAETEAETTTVGKKTETAAAAPQQNNSGTRINYSDQKGIWVPFMTLAELMQGRSEAQFRAGFEELCDNSKALGVNTLYVHTRAFSDAFYKSSMYPWSKWVTGAVGGDPGYDPLEIMIDCAHSRGLSLHAWINPYRAEKPDNLNAIPDSYIVKKWYSDPAAYPEYVNYVSSTGWCWLNPGIPAVREYIYDGVAEIASRYNVDGLHIDDYFYPTTETWFDAGAYATYGGGLSLADWRLWNCSETVAGIYRTVKAIDGDIAFGVAPSGNIEANYSAQYADVYRWAAEPGFLDYIAPQIYFGYNNSYSPFLQRLQQWMEMPRHSGAAIYIGLAPANIALVNEYTVTEDIIASQIADSYAYGADGVALYSYASFFMPERGYEDKAAAERLSTAAELNKH
ncbi:MAG: family 10 glycosylhydrolase [Ruminococcus sp.]|nr:family 10 glycosylhydrolase [Ruminococcus sp.]